MARVKKSTWLPLLLLAYLCVMAAIGWRRYVLGIYSPLYYWGIIALTLAVIALLHFNLKRRERRKK